MKFAEADACLHTGTKVMLIEGIGTERLESLYGKALSLLGIEKSISSKEKQIVEVARIRSELAPNCEYRVRISDIKVIVGFEAFVSQKAHQLYCKI